MWCGWILTITINASLHYMTCSTWHNPVTFYNRGLISFIWIYLNALQQENVCTFRTYIYFSSCTPVLDVNRTLMMQWDEAGHSSETLFVLLVTHLDSVRGKTWSKDQLSNLNSGQVKNCLRVSDESPRENTKADRCVDRGDVNKSC